MKRILRTYPLTLLVLAAILFLSLFNPPESDLGSVKGIDKIAHICMYGGLELVLWFEYLRHHDILDRTKLIWLAIIAPVAYSGAMELAQLFLTDYRSGEWADLAANTIGVLAGNAAGYWIIRPYLKSRS